MTTQVSLDTVYAASDDVVAREIEFEIIIIPLLANDTENSPYTLNPTGQAFWQRLDGRRSLKDIVADLATEFNSTAGEIEKDVIWLVEELLNKRLLIEVSRT